MSATNTLVRVEREATGEQCVAASEAVLLFKDKWTILVLGSLSHAGSLRYNLVSRTVFASVPPRVDYALTPVGRSLAQPLKALLEWSLAHRAEMAAARRAYAGKGRVETRGARTTSP